MPGPQGWRRPGAGDRWPDLESCGHQEGTSMAPHRARARALGIIVLAAIAFAALPVSASAGGNGATVVRGIQLAAGTCGDGGYWMTGSLEGCWQIETFVPKGAEDKAHYRATGRERFDGCLGSVCGAFFTTYSFTAKTDGPWPTSPEIHGRCHHPITGGEGGFAGASGELSFHDVVDVSPPYYPYQGNIHLAAGAGGSAKSAARAASVATASATSTTC